MIAISRPGRASGAYFPARPCQRRPVSAWVSVCWPGQPSFQRVRCCILAGVDSPFNSRVLRIQQPGKLLPDRANYEIFDDQRRLVAIAAETEAHTRRQVLSKSTPDARYYTLIDGQDQILGEVVGDLALRHFSITGSAGTEFARIRKPGPGSRTCSPPPTTITSSSRPGPGPGPGPHAHRGHGDRA